MLRQSGGASAITLLLVIALIAVGVVLYQTQRKLSRIRERLDDLESRAFSGSIGVSVDQPAPEFRVAAKVTSRRAATVVSALPPPPEIARVTEPEPELTKSRFADLSFESLVGGKLPIWVGGISLVFAGFFLVRFTIEAGLFGPGARSITATIFAFAMIAMSELGGRLPKIGASFTADPRVAQSLAGAGVATLYGTLYMAAEIYGLVGVPTAFIFVVLVTAIAFALSLASFTGTPLSAHEVDASGAAQGLVIHDAASTLRNYCAADSEGRLWLTLPGGSRFELITFKEFITKFPMPKDEPADDTLDGSLPFPVNAATIAAFANAR